MRSCALVEQLESGEVAALLVAGLDLMHSLPGGDSLAEAIGKVPLVVSFAEREDELTALAGFVCPDHHPLESWLDAEPVSGVVSLIQPTLNPLGDTRSILESVARWSGDAAADSTGRTSRKICIRDGSGQFGSETFLPRGERDAAALSWDQAVHDGVVQVSAPPTSTGELQAESVQLVAAPKDDSPLALELYQKVGLTAARHAHNPWLQELPDPVTKVTWDNYVGVSPALAAELDLNDGDVVRVAVAGRPTLDLPALVQPGQHHQVISVALEYGVRGSDRFANVGPEWIEARATLQPGELVGKNAADLIEVRDGALHYARGGVTLENTGQRRPLASTQGHHTMSVPKSVAPYGGEVRDPVQHTTLAQYVEDPAAGTPVQHHDTGHQLWPEDHPKTGHAWGMVVDLNACTGCSACVIACQAENNVPVVGKDEVRRQREMHWIRLDRYYSEEDDGPVLHQVMMCQHCDNAPCETVLSRIGHGS